MLEPGGDYLTTIWRDHVYPLADQMNMPMNLPPIQPRSRLAHEAAKWAGSYDRLYEYNLALFKAFFTDGLDIGKEEILVDLALDIGLDSDDLSVALGGHVFLNEVLADQDEARRIGVNAVPAFAIEGRVAAAGVQTADRLQSLLSMQPL